MSRLPPWGSWNYPPPRFFLKHIHKQAHTQKRKHTYRRALKNTFTGESISRTITTPITIAEEHITPIGICQKSKVNSTELFRIFMFHILSTCGHIDQMFYSETFLVWMVSEIYEKDLDQKAPGLMMIIRKSVCIVSTWVWEAKCMTSEPMIWHAVVWDRVCHSSCTSLATFLILALFTSFSFWNISITRLMYNCSHPRSTEESVIFEFMEKENIFAKRYWYWLVLGGTVSVGSSTVW